MATVGAPKNRTIGFQLWRVRRLLTLTPPIAQDFGKTSPRAGAVIWTHHRLNLAKPSDSATMRCIGLAIFDRFTG
jgi:hypothetical protein